MQDHAGKGSVNELALGVWSRRRGLAVTVFALVFAGTAGITAFLPNIYRSTATVLVERHQVSETFVRSSVTSELETRLQTIGQEVLSRARLEGLITRFSLYPDMRSKAPMEAIVEKMRRDIRLEFKGAEQMSGRTATVAFNLSYRGRDPETVAQVANTLASFYVEENSKIRERQASQTTQFLKVQLEATKARLDEQEARVRNFRARHLGELPQQMGLNLATLERLQAQLHLNSTNLLRARDQRAALLKQLTGSDASGAGADSASARLIKLKRELVELRTRFSDKYPDVVRVKTEIAALERELVGVKADGSRGADATATDGDPSASALKAALSPIDMEIESLKAEEQRLRRDISAYQRRVENAPQREEEFRELSRDFDTTKELHASLLKRYEDAQLAENMEQIRQGEQFRILDPAIPGNRPAAPNRIFLGLLGTLLAVGSAATAAVLAEHLDTSFHTFDDLGSFTKVPVLARIPQITTKIELRRRRWRRPLAASAACIGIVVIVGLAYLVANGNESLVSLLARRGGS